MRNLLSVSANRAQVALSRISENKAKYSKTIVVAATAGAAGNSFAAVPEFTTTTFAFDDWISSVYAGMTLTLNGSAPSLYVFMAAVGGFFFVWNRIRSLW